MSLFGNLKRDDDIQESTGFSRLDTGVYDAVIKIAYAGKSAGGAQFVRLEFSLANGQDYKETIYVSSGDAKGNKNFYTKDGKKYYLPGFITVDEMAAVTTGQLLADQETEEKTVKMYDSETKQEVEREAPVLMDMIGKKLKLGIQKSIEFKQADNGSGKWVDTPDTIEKNEIVKVFDTDGFSFTELMEKAEEPVAMEKWLERNEGKTRDRTAGKKPKATGSGSGTPPAPKKSLFGK